MPGDSTGVLYERFLLPIRSKEYYTKSLEAGVEKQGQWYSRIRVGKKKCSVYSWRCFPVKWKGWHYNNLIAQRTWAWYFIFLLLCNERPRMICEEMKCNRMRICKWLKTWRGVWTPHILPVSCSKAGLDWDCSMIVTQHTRAPAHTSTHCPLAALRWLLARERTKEIHNTWGAWVA